MCDISTRGRSVVAADRILRVAVRAPTPRATHKGCELTVVRAGTQRPFQVVRPDAEEAEVQLPLGRQARPGAGGAERSGDARDDPHLAGPVAIAVATGDLAPIRGLERLQGQLSTDGVDDLRRGHDIRHLPAVGVTHVHVLDEPDDPAPATGFAGQRQDAVLVDAPPHDGIDLDGRETGRRGGLDALDHARHGHAHVIEPAEDRIVERVEADRDPAQTGIGKAACLAGEQGPVGGHREVVEAIDAGEQLHEPGQVASEQRLAPGEPDLGHAVVHEEARQTRDLLERQQLRPGQEPESRPEHLPGHAVDAPEVAAIGDRDPQVVHRPPQPVEDRDRWVLGHRGMVRPAACATASVLGCRRPRPPRRWRRRPPRAT